MRRAIGAALVLLTSGCLSHPPVVSSAVSTATASSALPSQDSLSVERHVTDSVVDANVRRVLARADSLLKAMRKNSPQTPNLSETQMVQAERGVFSDSATHAARCEPVRANEDWRRVCVPRNQAIRIR